MDIDGNKVVYFGSGGSSDLGPAAERELLNWIEELCCMGIHLSGECAYSGTKHCKSSRQVFINFVHLFVFS